MSVPLLDILAASLPRSDPDSVWGVACVVVVSEGPCDNTVDEVAHGAELA